MRTKTLAMLVATTALTAAIGLPVWSAMRAPLEGGASQPLAALFDDGRQALPLIFVSDDDERGYRQSFRRGDHDDEDDDDDDCDDDDNDDCIGNARNPAPVGTVAPPQNGLFGNGAPPQVQVN